MSFTSSRCIVSVKVLPLCVNFDISYFSWRARSFELIKIFSLILATPELSAPKIIGDTMRHVTRGQTLRVNCTITVDADLTYSLIWNAPRKVRKSFISLSSPYTERFVTDTTTEKNVILLVL